MLYNIDSGIFVDIKNEERLEIIRLCKNIILNGITPSRDNEIVKEFMSAFGVNEHNFLLVISTVFPQRMLLSLLLSET